ncbi:unnamed protein product, partial [marine sediment metagenome]
LGFWIGHEGTYELSGGQLVLEGALVNVFGFYEYHGVFIQTGGTNIGSSELALGMENPGGGIGEYHLSGDGVVSSENMIVGAYDGTGIFTQTGGTNISPFLALAPRPNSNGTYTISSGVMDIGFLAVGSEWWGWDSGRFKIIGDEATINMGGYHQDIGGILELDINGISTINANTVYLDGDLDVEFLELPTVGELFTIISNAGSDPVEGFFEGKPDNSVFTVDGPLASTVDLRIDYDGGSGNDVVLSVMSIPEPATLALLLLGGLALLRRRK